MNARDFERLARKAARALASEYREYEPTAYKTIRYEDAVIVLRAVAAPAVYDALIAIVGPGGGFGKTTVEQGRAAIADAFGDER